MFYGQADARGFQLVVRQGLPFRMRWRSELRHALRLLRRTLRSGRQKRSGREVDRNGELVTAEDVEGTDLYRRGSILTC